MSRGPFTPTTVRWLVGIGAVSFLGGLALAVFGPELERPPSHGTDSYSRSAIGHHALVETLRGLGITVVSSRHASRQRAGRAGLLVAAEPHDCPPGSPRAAALRALLAAAPRALLVLPKWSAREAEHRSGWVEALSLRDASEPQDALTAIGADLRVRRLPAHELGPWTTRLAGYVPTFPLPSAQLLQGNELRPLVSCDQGVLLGEWRAGGGRLLVLADPDLLCNGGLGQGSNAALVVAAIDSLRPAGGPVVVDETIHGFARVPSLWRELFSFPLVVLVLHGALLLAGLLWAGTGRFGAAQRPPPAFQPGRRFLIANTAELLRYRGHVATAVRDYLHNAVRDVRAALKTPAQLQGQALEAWLDRVGAARGATDRLADLRTGARLTADGPGRSGPMLAAATRIHRWRQEILHGPSGHSQHP